jgi:hypothetical protein
VNVRRLSGIQRKSTAAEGYIAIKRGFSESHCSSHNWKHTDVGFIKVTSLHHTHSILRIPSQLTPISFSPLPPFQSSYKLLAPTKSSALHHHSSTCTVPYHFHSSRVSPTHLLSAPIFRATLPSSIMNPFPSFPLPQDQVSSLAVGLVQSGAGMWAPGGLARSLPSRLGGAQFHNTRPG